ncbi:MAG: carbohydrate-binding family 9-like protein [Acidobacteria bacterium]|nr:carbohydrate-binding family 9-like protein [Acidobacteriota bacterium]
MSDETQIQPAQYTCHRARGPLLIDGRLDEPDWVSAPQSAPFVDIVTGQPAWFDTRVALLWDDEALYFGFWAREPNLQARFTERDSKIWFDNDLEIFVGGRDAYYEFEINAFNTIYEVLWIWKDILKPGGPYDPREWDPARRRVMSLAGVGGHCHPRGERWGFLDWDLPGLKHAVRVDGTLNDPSDTDRGWTAEIALPWEGLRPLADGRSLPPQDGDVWRIDCSRFQSADRGGNPFPPGEGAGWTWNRHGHYDSHIPEVFPYVRFSTQLAR